MYCTLLYWLSILLCAGQCYYLCLYIHICVASESIPSLNKRFLPGSKCGHNIDIRVADTDTGSGVMQKSQSRHQQQLKAPMEKNAKTVAKIKERLAKQGKTYVERGNGGGAGDASGENTASSGDRKRKVGFEELGDNGAERKRSVATASKPNAPMSAGLSKTIHELLDNYVPASNFEPTAFFCRVCKHTSANEEEFLAHKASELHLRMQQEERKRSECRLCRKQFTSPDQLKGHLNGAKHKEKLASVKKAQQVQKKFC